MEPCILVFSRYSTDNFKSQIIALNIEPLMIAHMNVYVYNSDTKIVISWNFVSVNFTLKIVIIAMNVAHFVLWELFAYDPFSLLPIVYCYKIPHIKQWAK